MKRKSKKILSICVLCLVASMGGSVGLLSACKKHVHHYQWKYDEAGTEHWKECPDDGAELEGSRGDHVFVLGECECGATQTVAEKKYGKAHGQVKLRGIGGQYEYDFSDVTVDMGDDVDPEFDTETGELYIENIEAGKIHTLTITKPEYQPYVASVFVEENDDVEIGGSRGMVLQRDSFDTTVNWGNYNLSKANEETGEISVTNRHCMVLTKNKYDEVAFTLNLNGFKRPGGGIKQGLPLVDDDGKTIEQGIALAFGKDVLSVRMVGKNKVALWNTWIASEWNGGNALTGEQENGELYVFNKGEQYLKDFDANNLALTVYRKENNISVFLNGTLIGNSTVDDKYKDEQCSVGIIAHNAVDDISWKHWNFTVDSGNKDVTLTNNTASDANGTITVPASVKFGDSVTLTVTPATDYKLSALLINGVNVIKDLHGNSYSFVITKDTTVEAQFAEIAYSSVNATVSGKAFGKTTALPQDTEVTLTSNGFGDITAQLSADGLKIERIPAGVWTVNIEGYLPVEITVDDGAAYSTAIILERDPFNTTVNWGEFNFENANDVKGKFGVSDGNFLILSNERYNDVAVTIYLNGSSNDAANGEQGIAIAFGGTDVLTVRMVGTNKLALWNIGWFVEMWGKGGNALTGEQENGEMYIFDEEGQYLKDFASGTLRLTVYRTRNEIIVYLNDTMVGRGAVDEKYSNADCSVGFVGKDMASSWKYWDFTVETENMPEIQKFTVTDNTADGAHGTLTGVPNGKQDFDTSVTLTVTPDSDYKLSALLINGVNVLKDVKDNKYTFTVKGDTTVEARFEAIIYSSVKSVVKGKSFGKTAALAVGTQVTLSQTGLDDIVKTITADGLEIDKLSAGVWTVKVAGYLNTEITVIDGKKYSDAIVLERDAFNTTVNWGKFDFEKANNATGEFSVANDCFLILSNEMYDDVGVTMYLNGNQDWKDDIEQGIVIAFGGTDVLTVRMVGKNRLALGNIWIAKESAWGKGTHALTESQENGELYIFAAGETYLSDFASGTLRLTVFRRGNQIFIYLNDNFIASSSVDGKYADAKCSVGFVGDKMEKSDTEPNKTWKFEVIDVPVVTVEDKTAENAGGTISITSNAKVGDTVTITVTPESTHALKDLIVSGGIIPQRQPDGTYKFVAYQLTYTVTAVFAKIPTQNVIAPVFGKKFDGTAVTVEDGTKIKFTSKIGVTVELDVSEGKINGNLLPGEYQVTADGYYGTTATVTETFAIENGITLEKLIFETNSINHSLPNSETYLKGAGNTNPEKVVASADGKIYEWSIAEYDDVAVSFTFKKVESHTQGIVMHFADGKDVNVRIEGTKVQWMGGNEDWAWFWGTYPVNNIWDFGEGEAYANPLSSTLLNDYNGNDGLKLTLVRRGGTVYALINGKIYSAQSVGELASNKVKFAVFVEDAKQGYEIPFEITTQAYEVLEKAGVVLSEELTGFVGDWTKNEGNLTASGAACYAQFDAANGVYKESVTMHISSSVGDDQGLIYKFSDGKYMAIRYQYNEGNLKIQYTEDTTLFQKAHLKTWTDFMFNEDEKESFKKVGEDGGLDLTFIRDGKTFYVMLGNRLLDTSYVDEKYAQSGGNMGIMVWNGTGNAFKYSHATGDDVTVPANS